MSEGAGTTIVLRVTSAAPSPAGQLCWPHGSPESFDGWLQLLGALERAFGILADTAAIDDSNEGPPASAC